MTYFFITDSIDEPYRHKILTISNRPFSHLSANGDIKSSNKNLFGETIPLLVHYKQFRFHYPEPISCNQEHTATILLQLFLTVEKPNNKRGSVNFFSLRWLCHIITRRFYCCSSTLQSSVNTKVIHFFS